MNAETSSASNSRPPGLERHREHLLESFVNESDADEKCTAATVIEYFEAVRSWHASQLVEPVEFSAEGKGGAG